MIWLGVMQVGDYAILSRAHIVVYGVNIQHSAGSLPELNAKRYKLILSLFEM